MSGQYVATPPPLDIEAGEVAEPDVPIAADPGHAPVPEDIYGSWSPTPSPDGDRVAFVSDRGGEPQIWVADLELQQLARLPATLHRVQAVSWSPDGTWLAAVTAAAGASRQQVWLIRPDSSDLHLVAGRSGSTAGVGAGRHRGWSADGRLLVTETVGDTSTALLLDPGTGVRMPVATGSLAMLLDVSRDAQRALLRRGPRDARRLSIVDPAHGTETSVITGNGPGSVHGACLSPDGSTVYACSDVGREFAALVAVPADGSTGPTVLAERPDAELQDVALDSAGRVAALSWNLRGGRSALSTLDLFPTQGGPLSERRGSGSERPVAPLPREVVDECAFLPNAAGLLVTAEGWSDARGVWALDLSGDAVMDGARARPVSSTGSATLRGSLGATTSAVHRADLVRPTLRELRSADGLVLTGWLYTPAGPGPWPTMIHLHGGPEAQERPVYNSLFQSVVAARVAVFAPNVRGSSGFGRTFRTADDFDGRYGAIADVAASHAHLVETGVAEPHRVGCMGRSYGGYLTLAALVTHPELFAVGVDICGMVDFSTFFARTEPWIAAAAISKYGDPARDAELLRDLSPIHRIDKLTAPLLVVHGADDTNVPVSQAEQLVAALGARGLEHRYLLFEGEGHELLETPNRVAFVQETVSWVVQHLRPLPAE